VLLKDTWEQPSRSMSELVPLTSTTTTTSSTDISLWELGNLFTTSAFQARRALGLLRVLGQICAEGRAAAELYLQPTAAGSPPPAACS
jgi:hypothetical protein